MVIPLLSGLLFSLCLPPFNHEQNILLAPFPFLGFAILIPLLLSVQTPFKRAIVHTYLFSITAALSQFY